jgi:hypothetical protein
MTASAEPQILADVGAVAVAELGPLVVVVDRGTGPSATVAFVPGSLPWCSVDSARRRRR